MKQEIREQVLQYIQLDSSLQKNPKLLAYILIFVKDELLVEQVEFI